MFEASTGLTVRFHNDNLLFNFIEASLYFIECLRHVLIYSTDLLLCIFIFLHTACALDGILPLQWRNGKPELDKLWESHPNWAQSSKMAKLLQPLGYCWHYSAFHGNAVSCKAKEIKCQLVLNNLDFPHSRHCPVSAQTVSLTLCFKNSSETWCVSFWAQVMNPLIDVCVWLPVICLPLVVLEKHY